MSAPGATDVARLDGQVALVTGAGRGIGRAIALALGTAGAAVAACARSEDEISATAAMIETGGSQALAVRADVSDRHDVNRAVARVEAELGPVDLLVNNAGVGGSPGALAAGDPDQWWQTIQVNLGGGPYYCSRAVLPTMLGRGHGRIVNVSSHAGFGPWPMNSAYAVSKAALLRLTENLAAETAGQGVQVFSIIPGEVRTAMTEGALSCADPGIAQFFQGIFDSGADHSPEHAAALVTYLASGQADALSGRCLSAVKDLAGIPGVHADGLEMVARTQEILEQDLYVLRFRELAS